MPIVDSHIHVFESDSPAYPRDKTSPIQPDFAAPVEGYIEAMAQADVDQAVLIQHICYGYDNRYILDCVRRYPDKFCAVVMVDPLAPDGGEQLRALAVERGARGLRLQPAVDPASTWLNQPRTFSVWEAAADLQLVIGILLDPRQLAQAEAVIRQFPTAPVVIDHMGRLSADSPPDAEPFQRLLRLARYPNVWVKLSGFYAFSRQPFPYPDMTPYVQRLWRAFGRERLMWATDYPLSVGAGEAYAASRGGLKFHLPDLSAEDAARLMGRTAHALYHLP